VRGALAFLGAVVLLAAARSAHASHYDLSSIDLVAPAAVEVLSRLGIQTTEDLWKATRSARDVSKLARKLKVPRATVQEWAEVCDLLRLDGVGPKMARVFRLAGVRRLRDLAREDPERLTARIAEVNRREEILGKLPDVNAVRGWVDEANAKAREPVRPGGRPKGP